MTLGHAVGATFTLDLESALVAPFAAASRVLADTLHPIAALEALRSTTDRIDIFFQNGHLAAPTARSGLHAFLEQVLHPVVEPNPGHLFHPKFWLLKFVPAHDRAAPLVESLFRLVVTSRNITTDASWDVVVGLDGRVPDRRPQAINAPISRLIRALPTLTQHEITSERVSRLDELAEEVRRVEWDPPAGVDQLAFHVFGIEGQPVTADFDARRMLVVSPFATDDGLLLSGGRSLKEQLLVSRQDQIDLLSEESIEWLEGNVMVIDPLAGLADYTDPPDDGTPASVGGQLAGLHAKMYAAESGRAARVFIGSANATSNAFSGNVEILVEMIGSTKNLGIDAILGTNGMGPILLPAGPSGLSVDTEALEDDHRLDAAVRSLASIDVVAYVMARDGAHHLEVRSTEPAAIPEGMTASLELPTAPGQVVPLTNGEPVAAEIGPLLLSDITAWIILRVKDHRGILRSTTVKMRLVNDPPDRLDAVLASQIDTTEKFLLFLRLLLSLDSQAWMAGSETAGAPSGHGFFGTAGESGLFESLVRALGQDISALDSIGDLIRRLESAESGKSVVPPELAAMWPTFQQAVAVLRGNRS